MSNTVLAIDMLIGVMQVSAEINQMLKNAAVEGRDITDEELATLKAANDAAAQAILNS